MKSWGSCGCDVRNVIEMDIGHRPGAGGGREIAFIRGRKFRSEAGIVAASVYAGGKRVAGVAIEEAGEWSKRPGHVVWIGLFEPSYDLLARVQAQFDLHPLAIEDAGKPHQHPKLEQYGEALFIVARTAQIVDGRIAFGETHIFMVVTAA